MRKVNKTLFLICVSALILCSCTDSNKKRTEIQDSEMIVETEISAKQTEISETEADKEIVTEEREISETETRDEMLTEEADISVSLYAEPEESIIRYRSDGYNLIPLEDGALKESVTENICEGYGIPWNPIVLNPEETIERVGINAWGCFYGDNFLKIFNSETYEVIGLNELLGDEWRNYCEIDDEHGEGLIENIEEFDTDKFWAFGFKRNDDILNVLVTASDPKWEKYVSIEINMPIEKVNKKYFVFEDSE